MKDYENTIKAFTDWLDQECKDYFILVRDIDGEGTNLCGANGDMKQLSVTLSSGMLDHPPLEQLFSNAVMMMVMKKYADKHGMSHLFDDEEDEEDDDA